VSVSVTSVRCQSVDNGWVTMIPVGRGGATMTYPLSDFDRMDFVPVPGMTFDLGTKVVSTELKGVVSSSLTGGTINGVWLESVMLISVGNVKRPDLPAAEMGAGG